VEFILHMCELHNKNFRLDHFAIHFSLSVSCFSTGVSSVPVNCLHNILIHTNYIFFFLTQISPSPDCVRALTKMTGCPACQGLPELKACSNYCINVMKGCLAYQAELDADWNSFVGDVLIT